MHEQAELSATTETALGTSPSGQIQQRRSPAFVRRRASPRVRQGPSFARNAGGSSSPHSLDASPGPERTLAHPHAAFASAPVPAGRPPDTLPNLYAGTLRGRHRPDRKGGRTAPAALRTTGIRRSIETTRTSSSTRCTPRTRTRHKTASAPWRHHLRRRRDSHTACAWTRARWRTS